MKLSARLLLLSPLLVPPLRAQATHVEEARFVAPPGAGALASAQSVGWSAGRAAVGDVRSSAPGRVHTYTTNAGLWQLDASATAFDGAANDRFGWALAIEDDTLVVGAPGSGDLFGNGAGAAYVLARTGATWTHVQKFTPSNPVSQGLFGQAVALDGNTLAIGHPQAPPFAMGEVDVYVKSGGTWVFQQKLVPGGLNIGARAGGALALEGDRLVVGAANQTSSGTASAGRVYVFERAGGTWTETTSLQSPAPITNGVFGSALALDANRIAVGAIGEPFTNGLWGRVHTFTGSGSSWTSEQTLIGSGTSQQNVAFGTSLALQGPRLLVGAPGRNIPVSGGSGAGALMLFEQSGGTWGETAVLWGSQTASADRLGQSCALAGDLALAGSGLDEDSYAWRLDPPTPFVYCTAKVTSAGCVPSIGWSGAPSASSAAPFLVTATQVANENVGLLIYGQLYNQAPFQAGTLCVGSPILRTAGQFSGGSATGSDCTGTFAYDFNALIDAGTDPALVAGQWVWSQYWFRDPPAVGGIGLSDALRFRILP